VTAASGTLSAPGESSAGRRGKQVQRLLSQRLRAVADRLESSEVGSTPLGLGWAYVDPGVEFAQTADFRLLGR